MMTVTVEKPPGGHNEGMKKVQLAMMAFAAAATLGLGGCGGSLSNNGADIPQNVKDQMVKFAQCMRDHGINVPDPDGSAKVVAPAAGSDPKFEAANAACAKYRVTKDRGENAPADEQDAALKKAECLRKQGINAKDPKPGTADISIDEGPGDTQEKLVAAYTICNKQVPSPTQPQP
jgi:hypothetical protein